jgi:hypothetical protein
MNIDYPGKAASEGTESANKIDRINSLLSAWLRSGKIVFDQPSSYRITDRRDSEKGFLVEMESLETSEKKFLDDFDQESESIEGSCQKLAPVLAGKLKQLGLIDDFEYVIDDQMTHHVAIVATIDERRVLIDVGRRKPIPVVVPIDDKQVVSGFYTGDPDIFYTATESEGIVRVLVQDPTRKGENTRTLLFRGLKSDQELIKTAIDALKFNHKLTRAEIDADGGFTRVSVLDTERGQLRIAVLEALKKDDTPVYMNYGDQDLGRIN